jgi:peptide/nickel transport system permease protein
MAQDTTTSELAPIKNQGRFDFKKRFQWVYVLIRHPQARIGFIIMLLMILMAIFAPIIAPGGEPVYVDTPNLPPGGNHILGVDPLGRDEFALVVWGARISLEIGFGTGILALLVATIIGMTAGYFGGMVDNILTLIINLFLVIPGLPMLILFAAYMKQTTTTVILTLAFTGWAFHGRIIRAQTLSLREKDYVAAAIVAGENNFTIIFRQILPNMINIIVGGIIGSSIYGIAASTALAFLGLTNMEDISWGTNLFWAQNGNSLLLGAWWVFVPSGFLVALAALALTWINYGMDEITNPRLRSERELRKVIRKVQFKTSRATPVLRREH